MGVKSQENCSLPKMAFTVRHRFFRRRLTAPRKILENREEKMSEEVKAFPKLMEFCLKILNRFRGDMMARKVTLFGEIWGDLSTFGLVLVTHQNFVTHARV